MRRSLENNISCNITGHYQVYRERNGKIYFESEHKNKLFKRIFKLVTLPYNITPILQISNQIDLSITDSSDNFASVHSVSYDKNVEKYFHERLVDADLKSKIKDIVITDTEVIGQASFVFRLSRHNIGNITGFQLVDSNEKISVAHVKDSTGQKSTIPHTENDITYIVYIIRFVYSRNELQSKGLKVKDSCNSTLTNIGRLFGYSRNDSTSMFYMGKSGAKAYETLTTLSLRDITPDNVKDTQLHLQSNVFEIYPYIYSNNNILSFTQDDLNAGTATLVLYDINPIWYDEIELSKDNQNYRINVQYTIVIKINEGISNE